MNIVVEKNISIPQEKENAVFSALMGTEVGDSFLLPLAMRVAVTLKMTKARKRTDRRFISKKVDDSHFRCWRVS